MTLWNKFNNNFKEIIQNIDDYNKILKFSIDFSYNLLFYSCVGFPFDLFIDEIIKSKFGISQIYRKEILWNKSIIYNEKKYSFNLSIFLMIIKCFLLLIFRDLIINNSISVKSLNFLFILGLSKSISKKY